MHHTSQEENSTTLAGWDEAISRVDSEIERMDKYLTRLKATRKTFILSKDQGIKWPGSVREVVNTLKGKAGTDSASIPA
jgi:hypothetical protein